LKEVCEENKEYGNGRKTNGGNGDGIQEIHFSFNSGLVDYYTFDFGWEKFFNFLNGPCGAMQKALRTGKP
jgi:hypothetical protein